MSPFPQSVLEDEPDPADVCLVQEGLREYNRQYAPDDSHGSLTVFLRDADQAVVGGLLGGTYWGWLHVDILRIREGFRHSGHGKAMLQMAEQEAIRRGCRHAHLETHDFQALPFYEKLGYTVFAQLSDLPEGHIKYFLQKEL
jgi:ribosomal protein S18 acetylase RimI-like enzyme